VPRPTATAVFLVALLVTLDSRLIGCAVSWKHSDTIARRHQLPTAVQPFPHFSLRVVFGGPGVLAEEPEVHVIGYERQ
jgi:hypothetical protein